MVVGSLCFFAQELASLCSCSCSGNPKIEIDYEGDEKSSGKDQMSVCKKFKDRATALWQIKDTVMAIWQVFSMRNTAYTSHSLTPWAKFNLFIDATTNSSSIQTMCQMLTKASVRLGLDAVNHRKKQQDIHLYVDQMSEHKTKEKRLEVVKYVTNLSSGGKTASNRSRQEKETKRRADRGDVRSTGCRGGG